MSGLSLAEYKEQFEIPDDFSHRGEDYSGIFMDSFNINQDLQDGQGFLAPQNLLALSPEALDELQVEMAGVYDDIDSSMAFFDHVYDMNNGRFTHQFPIRGDNKHLPESLVVGTVADMKIDRNTPPADDYKEAADAVTDEFRNTTGASLQQVIDIKPEFDRLSEALYTGGTEALNEAREAIQALPEFAEQQLLTELTQKLEEHAGEPAVQEFLETLDATINAPEAEADASTAPAWVAEPAVPG